MSRDARPNIYIDVTRLYLVTRPNIDVTRPNIETCAPKYIDVRAQIYRRARQYIYTRAPVAI